MCVCVGNKGSIFPSGENRELDLGKLDFLHCFELPFEPTGCGGEGGRACRKEISVASVLERVIQARRTKSEAKLPKDAKTKRTGDAIRQESPVTS